MNMNKKITGALLGAILSVSTLSLNAFAGDYNHKKMQKTSMHQTMPSRISDRDPDVNPYLDPAVPDSGVVLSMDNVGVSAVTGSVLTNDLNYNKSDLKQDQIEQNSISTMDNSTSTEAITTDPTISDDLKDAVHESLDPNANTSYDPAANTAITTTTGSGTVNGMDINSIDILQKYEGNVSNCIDELSTLNGEIVKNDAFYACQRYKLN